MTSEEDAPEETTSVATRQMSLEEDVGDLVERGGVVGRDVWVISPRRASTLAPKAADGERDPRSERSELVELLASHGMLATVVQYGLLPAEAIRPSDWTLDTEKRKAAEARREASGTPRNVDPISALARLLARKLNPFGEELGE
jgi:hypothetical protein